MSDSRINVYIDVDTWVLVLYKVVPADEATYECHVNSDPPQKVAIHLFVKGECAELYRMLTSSQIHPTVHNFLQYSS